VYNFLCGFNKKNNQHIGLNMTGWENCRWHTRRYPGSDIQITEWEKEFFENSSEPYIRVYDRTIDGHKGIFAIQGDSPDDPSMERMGLYWLNEAEDGTATELILVVSSETEIVADNMINTVHVEKITRH
jgi:hypothetical protein